MCINVLLECGGAASLGKAVGVLAVGQQEHLYVHTLCQKHVYTSQGGFYTGLISVIEHGDVVGETVDKAYLTWGERGAA